MKNLKFNIISILCIHIMILALFTSASAQKNKGDNKKQKLISSSFYKNLKVEKVTCNSTDPNDPQRADSNIKTYLIKKDDLVNDTQHLGDITDMYFYKGFYDNNDGNATNDMGKFMIAVKKESNGVTSYSYYLGSVYCPRICGIDDAGYPNQSISADAITCLNTSRLTPINNSKIDTFKKYCMPYQYFETGDMISRIHVIIKENNTYLYDLNRAIYFQIALNVRDEIIGTQYNPNGTGNIIANSIVLENVSVLGATELIK